MVFKSYVLVSALLLVSGCGQEAAESVNGSAEQAEKSDQQVLFGKVNEGIAGEDTADGQLELKGMAKAKAEGASFWAVGNEPGWSLAIYPEEKLMFVTDYGAKVVTASDPGAQTDGNKTLFNARTEANVLRVELTAQPCEDTMSGEVRDYQVNVTHNDTLYVGCGRDL